MRCGARQLGLSPLDRLDIKVVGRLSSSITGRFAGQRFAMPRASPFVANGNRVELQPSATTATFTSPISKVDAA
jgi:hypothetical protein